VTNTYKVHHVSSNTLNRKATIFPVCKVISLQVSESYLFFVTLVQPGLQNIWVHALDVVSCLIMMIEAMRINEWWVRSSILQYSAFLNHVSQRFETIINWSWMAMTCKTTTSVNHYFCEWSISGESTLVKRDHCITVLRAVTDRSIRVLSIF